MDAAEATAPKKAPAKKQPVAKKATTRKTRAGRKARSSKPMSPATRALAAQIVGSANEAALANEALGVKRSNTGELPGARSGMRARIVLDDGTIIAVTVAVRTA